MSISSFDFSLASIMLVFEQEKITYQQLIIVPVLPKIKIEIDDKILILYRFASKL
jgi:hypothetical protein